MPFFVLGRKLLNKKFEEKTEFRKATQIMKLESFKYVKIWEMIKKLIVYESNISVINTILIF